MSLSLLLVKAFLNSLVSAIFLHNTVNHSIDFLFVYCLLRKHLTCFRVYFIDTNSLTLNDQIKYVDQESHTFNILNEDKMEYFDEDLELDP